MLSMVIQIQTKIKHAMCPLPTAEERISVWEKACGIWKQRKSSAIRELAKMRREWERKLPTVR